jgi:ABC-type multidrug transport system fused ATPase/permease subunit
MTAVQRRAAAILLLFMLLGAGLEMLGVGLVLPLLGLMSQDGPLSERPVLHAMFGSLEHFSNAQLLAGSMIVLVGVCAFKALYLGFLTWWQAKFVFSFQLHLSRQLFDGYLRQPYTFHLQRNSAQLIRNVVNETSQLSHVATIPLLTLISESLVVLAICGLLVAIEPLGALLVTVTIGMAGLVFHRLTSRRLLRWGEARQHHEGMRLQHLQQGLGGVKDVKVLGREAQFLARFLQHDTAVAGVAQRHLTLQGLPRLWLELLGIIGLAALVLTMLAQHRPLDTLVPALGLFAAAAFRLMPSVTKIMSGIQCLRYAKPVVDTLSRELASIGSSERAQPAEPVPFKNGIRLDGVSYCYPDAPTPSLANIDLVISPGQSVGFVGGSGAGKSTLIDVVLGLLVPTSGAVRVDGVDIKTNIRGWQSQIGYVPQSIYLTDDTLRCNVAFGLLAEQIDEQAVMRALRAAQLEEFVSQLPEGLDTVVGERGVRLSGGQRQRIGIARALYHDPPVLVLDEATSALDVATERGVIEAVEALHGKKTILIVAHRISTVERCDSVVRLANGSIVDVGDALTVLLRPQPYVANS